MTNKRHGISAIKFEAAQIHFLSDLFVAVAVVVAWSFYMHLKYGKFLKIRDYCVSTFPNPQSFVPDAILTCSKLAAKLTSLAIKM